MRNKIIITPGAFDNYIFNWLHNLKSLENFFIEISDSLEIDNVKGVVFSGGADINPIYYGKISTGSYHDERDKFEFSLIKKIITHNKSVEKPNRIKVFGICRGLQLINVAFGGNLIFDISTSFGTGNCHEQYSHELYYNMTIKKFLNYDELPVVVNSLHHQGIQRLGSGLQIVAEAGSIPEIILSRCQDFFAVQFHPEIMNNKEIVPFKERIGDFLSGNIESFV